MRKNEFIDLSGHFYITLSVEEIVNSGGNYQQAVQDVVGHTGMIVTDVGDEDDEIELQESNE